MSISQTPETLKIVVLYNLKALRQKKYLILKENYFSEGLIPVQLATESEKQISALFEGGRISLTNSTIINILIGYLFQL